MLPRGIFSPQSSLKSVCLATEKKIHGISLNFSKRISYIKNLSGKYPLPKSRKFPPPLPPFCVNHTRQYTGKNLPVFFSQFAGGSQIVAKKVRWVQFYIRNPFKQNLSKISNFCSKKWRGVNFINEITLNEICENHKVLLKLEKKL